MRTSTIALGITLFCISLAHAEPTKLTKQQFVDATKIVADGYPGPFEKTFKQVVDKIGPPKKKGANMNEWFGLDGAKCVAFFMTKDNKKGHAASGIYDATAADCQ